MWGPRDHNTAITMGHLGLQALASTAKPMSVRLGVILDSPAQQAQMLPEYFVWLSPPGEAQVKEPVLC